MSLRALLLAPLAAALLGSIGCSGAPERHDEGEGIAPEPTGSTSEPLTTVTRSEAIANAEQWVQAKLQYCQSPNGQPDPDTACSSTCQRESNPAWDPYRSDCSGFVSWAWELPAPGRVTSTFAPFDTTVSNTIQCADLEPGDAANRDSGGHIVLFKEWVTPGTKAVFIEEPGCSASEPYAHEFTSDVTCSGTDVDIAYEGTTFTTIRYDDIVDDPVDAGTGDDGGGSAPDAGASSGDGGGGGAGGGSSSGAGNSGGDVGGGGGGTGGGGTAGGAGHGTSGGAASTSGADAGGAPVAWDTSNGAAGCSVGATPGRDVSGLGALALVGLALVRRRPRR